MHAALRRRGRGSRLSSVACASLLALLAACERPAERWAAALDDPDPFSRRLAAVALGRGARGAAETWVPALLGRAVEDADPDVRAAATLALVERAEEAAPIAVAALTTRCAETGVVAGDPVVAALTRVLAEMGPPALPRILDGLTPRAAAPATAAGALTDVVGAMRRTPDVARALARLASHPAAEVRRKALAALADGSPVPEAVVEAVIAVLDDPDTGVRLSAVQALAEAAGESDAALAAIDRARSAGGGSSVVDPAQRGWVTALLHRAAGDGPRADAARAGLQVEGPLAQSVAIENLRGHRDPERSEAAAWLATRGASIVVPILDGFSERIPSQFPWAVEVFAAIGRPALDALRREVAGDDELRAVKAALALGSWGPGARDAQPELAAALGSGEFRVRLAAVWACGGVGLHDAALLDVLHALRSSADEVTAVAATHAIVAGLAQGVADGDVDPDAAWAGLARLGAAARPTLRALLAAPSESDSDGPLAFSPSPAARRAARAEAARSLLAADPGRP